MENQIFGCHLVSAVMAVSFDCQGETCVLFMRLIQELLPDDRE